MLRREHNFKAGDLVTVVRGVYYGMNGHLAVRGVYYGMSAHLADRGVGIIVSEQPDDEEACGNHYNSCVCVLLGGDRIDIHHANLERVQ
jgi:hypothetical protein